MKTQPSTDNKQPEPSKGDDEYSKQSKLKARRFFKNRSQWLTHLTAATFLIVTTAVITSVVILSQLEQIKKIIEPKSSSNSATTVTLNSDQVSAVSAAGYIEPDGEVIHLSAPAFAEGARVEKLLVKRGDQVKAGDIVAILDSHERLTAALNLAQQRVEAAQARLDKVKAGAKQGAINAQSATIEQLKAELQGQIAAQQDAIASLQTRLRGEKEAQAATIERLQAELNYAETECLRYQTLYQDGAVSASIRDSKCLAKETAQKQLNEAQSNTLRIINTLENNINEAKANLNRTVRTLQKQITEAEATRSEIAEVRPVDVAVAQAELQEAKAAVEQAQSNLNLAYVRTPRSGQILKINTWAGELVHQEGIVELGQTDHMYVVAEVYETDISQIRLGQQATITSQGLDEELQGIVDDIGLQIGKKDVLGTDPAASADARVVEVKIRLNKEDSHKVSGLTNLEVNVVIDI